MITHSHITFVSFKEVEKFITKDFIRNETMCGVLKISPEDFLHLFRDVLKMCYFNEVSTAWFNEKEELIGVQLVLSFAEYQQWKLPDNVSKSGQILLNTFDLLESNSKYTPKNPEKTSLVFITNIRDDYKNKKVAHLIGKELERLNLKYGYKESVCDNTGKASQRLAEKHGYKPLGSIKYRDFQFEGEQPYRNVEPELELIRMVKF